VGEKEILVAILGVRNASISWPVGISNVLIIESRDVVISHRESWENAWHCISLTNQRTLRTYKIQHSAFETRELPDKSLCFYVKHPNDQVVADYRQKITISLQCERNYGGGEDERLLEIFGMEIEELRHVLVRMKVYVHLWLTLTVPSNVPATRVLFKASVASPVTHRFFPPFDPLPNWTATSLGAGPSTKDFLFKPDCMFQR